MKDSCGLAIVALLFVSVSRTAGLFVPLSIAVPDLPNFKDNAIFGYGYELRIRTVNVVKFGYTGFMNIQFTDENGRPSANFKLYVTLLPSTTYPALVYIDKQFGKINQIKFWINNFIDPFNFMKWSAEYISVTKQGTKESITFPCLRGIKQGSVYIFDKYNTYLPQLDPRKEERRKEIIDNRKLYIFSDMHKKDGYYDGTPLTKNFPANEFFPLNYTGYTALRIGVGLGENLLQRELLPGTWKSYDEMKNMFGKVFPFKLTVPLYINKDFKSDVWFGRQRLQGVNPATIKLATEIPNTFGVTDAILKNLLNGKSLSTALRDKRLFLIDYKIMHGLREKGFQVAAPIALFYLNDAGVFLPVAIQLFQGVYDSNPVFTPNDHPNVWQMAKNHFSVADGNHHESITHLGNTHLLIEGIIGCTYQNLAHNHPVFRLLRPHFLSTIAINKLAISLLVNDGGAIDLTIAITGKGMRYLAGRGLRDYDMKRDAIVPYMFDGVTKDKLPDYPFREDFSLLYNTIKDYVRNIIRYYYANDQVLKEDKEIQAWRVQLTASSDKNIDASIQGTYGLNLKGVPGSSTGFNTLDELIEVVTAIICTASVKHATINFLQYDWYAFAPHHPLYLSGPFPTNKNPISEPDILKKFAGRNRFLNLCLLVQTLSNRLTKNLGYFEVPMFYDPIAMGYVEKFRLALHEAHKQVVVNNAKRKENEYKWGDSDIIPNAISI